MGQHVQPQFPVHPAGHQRGVHPRPGNGAVGNGQQVCAGRLQTAGAFQIAGQVGVLGGIQLDGDHLLPGVQLAQEGVVFFHLRLCGSGNLRRRGCGQVFGQGIQRCTQGCNVCRGSAAAAAQNAHSVGCNARQLPGKIFRLALILHPGAGNDRVARVGHHRQRQRCRAQPLYQRAHGTRGRHTVQAHSVHRAAFGHAAHQLGAVAALAGVSVRQHRKGHQHKGVRHDFFDMLCRLGHAALGAQSFKEKVLCAQCCKAVGKGGVQLRRRQSFGVRCRAKVCKHGRTRLRSGLLRQLPALIGQHLPHGVARCGHPGQAEGIGLDGIGPGGQIFPVHGQNALRVGQVGLLALLTGLRFIISAHAAVEQQGPFFQNFTHISHGRVLLFLWKNLDFSLMHKASAVKGFRASCLQEYEICAILCILSLERRGFPCATPERRRS